MIYSCFVVLCFLCAVPASYRYRLVKHSITDKLPKRVRQRDALRNIDDMLSVTEYEQDK